MKKKNYKKTGILLIMIMAITVSMMSCEGDDIPVEDESYFYISGKLNYPGVLADVKGKEFVVFATTTVNGMPVHDPYSAVGFVTHIARDSGTWGNGARVSYKLKINNHYKEFFLTSSPGGASAADNHKYFKIRAIVYAVSPVNDFSDYVKNCVLRSGGDLSKSCDAHNTGDWHGVYGGDHTTNATLTAGIQFDGHLLRNMVQYARHYDINLFEQTD